MTLLFQRNKCRAKKLGKGFFSNYFCNLLRYILNSDTFPCMVSNTCCCYSHSHGTFFASTTKYFPLGEKQSRYWKVRLSQVSSGSVVWNFPGFSLRLDKVIYSGQSVGYKATDGIWLLRFGVPRFSSDPRHSCLMADHEARQVLCDTNHTSFFISSPYVALTPTAQCFCPAYLQSAFESRVGGRWEVRTCVIATEMEQRLLLCNFHPDHEGSDLLIFLETYTGSYASIIQFWTG